MEQTTVDVIELLKVQTINEFENILKQFRKGYSQLNLTKVLDNINFIDTCAYIEDASTTGRLMVDLSDLDSINTLKSWEQQSSQTTKELLY